MKKSFWLKLIVSVVLVGYLAATIKFDESLEVLSSANLWFLVLSIFLIILNYIFSALRWKYLIVKEMREKVENMENISTFSLIRLYFIGAFFNNFMPTSIGGDAYRIYKLGTWLKSTSHSFTATFFERFLGMLALIFFSFVGFSLYQVGDISIFILFTIFSILSIFIFAIFYPKFNFMIVKFPKILKIFDNIHASFMNYKNYPYVIVYSFLLSLGVQVFSILSQYVLFLALGSNPPLDYSFFAFPLIFLTGYAIPSINGLGSQDVLYQQFLSAVGISPAIALAGSILFHLSRVFVSIIGGVFYLIEKRKI